jgi:uncharacterized protein
MPDSSPGDDATSTSTRRDRRDRRVSRRRNRWRRVVTVVASIAIIAGFGLLATETVRFGGGDKPTLAGAVRSGDSATATGGADVPVEAAAGRPCRSQLTAANPLRLWIGGDSLAGSLGPALGGIAGATGVVQPYFDSRVSSGLTSPNFFDWPAQAEKEMPRLDPEIAVFIIGANDYTAPRRTSGFATTTTTTNSGASTSTSSPNATSTTVDGAASIAGEPWKSDYAARIDNMLSKLEGPNRTVIWVGPPPFGNERDNEDVQKISELSKQVIEHHPEAVFVDDYSLFLDANGKYSDKLPDDKGVLTTMRTGDGVHFTMDGAKKLARAVYALVDAQCHVAEQAVPGVTKVAIQTAGSTQVAPGSGNRQGEPVVTTPPATSSATTAAPAATTAPQATAPPTTSPPTTIATTAPTTLPPPTTTSGGGGNPHKP